MIADLIAKLLGLIKNGDYQKASETLDHAYYNFLKQDAADLRGIPKEDLTNKLLKEHNYKNGHLEILSMLFYAQAELFYAQKNHAESLEYYEKSLILLDFVVKESKTYSVEKQSQLALIQKRIDELKSG